MTPDVASRAPDFELSDSNGTPRTFASLVANGSLILVFFRGHW